MVVDRILLALVCPRGVLAFSLAGNFKNTRVRCVLLTAARDAARFEREVSMESYLVALSITREMVCLG